MRITRRRLHLEHTIVKREHGQVMRAATAIEDQHVLLTVRLLLQTICDRGGSGLVNNAEHIEAGDQTGILCRLTLGVIEIRGHRDNCVGHLLTEIGLSDSLHLLENHGGDLLRRECLRLTGHRHLNEGLLGGAGLYTKGPVGHIGLHGRIGELTTDETLGVEYCIYRVGRSL